MTVTLKCLAPRPMAQTRVVCVPYSGAGPSIYHRFAKAAPAAWEVYAVDAPGRETRLAEPSLTAWDVYVDALESALTAMPGGALVLYGHSLGALLALEAARRLEQRNAPAALVCCAAMPWPSGLVDRPRLSGLPDTDFVDAMAAWLGSVPKSLHHPDIRESVLPSLRADLLLLERYRFNPAPPLAAPLAVFAGDDDALTKGRNMDEWRAGTAGAFSQWRIPGGHFFLDGQEDLVIARMVEALG